MKTGLLGLAGALCLLAPLAAQAAPLASPGVYYGSGNINDGFTVSNIPNGRGTIEIGLSAIKRFIGPIAPSGSTYNVLTGDTSVPGKTGADWGFVFSVNLGTSGLTLGDIAPILSLTDVGLGTNGAFNLLGIPDNAHITPSGTNSNCATVASPACSNADTGFQNSEALSFFSVAIALGDPLFNRFANDTYLFGLDLYGRGTCTGSITAACGALLGSDNITVVAGTGANAVPEPGTLALFSAGLLGLGALRRRKAKAAA